MNVTTCQHCVFAKRAPDFLQTGCTLDRVDKFPHELIGLSFQLTGHCNTCRTIYWEPYMEHGAINAPLLECLAREIEVTYGVLVYYDGDKDALTKTLQSANGCLKPREVVICMDGTVKVHPLNVYDEFYKHFHPLFANQSQDNPFKNAIYKTNSQYVYFAEAGDIIDKEAIAHLNKVVNEDVKTAYLMVGPDFTICHRRVYEAIPPQDAPMEALYKSLTESKLKDTVINWPLS